jgi:cephalosporin-C deacetylase-like acetyl esterase
VRQRIHDVLGVDERRDAPVAARVLATIAKAGYRAEQFEIASEREIRTPGWLLSPDGATAAPPTVLYVGEGSAWGSVAEDAFAERLCAKGGCRVAIIDVRGRGDCAIAYPPRGRFYFPGRITDEAYLTWFTLMLGRPLLGGQVYDALRTLDYLRSRQDAGGPVSIVGDGAHGVIALYAAALDERVRGVALRRTVTDYRSLAGAERYTQPFGIYAYDILRNFDLPDIARATAPRPVLMLDPMTPAGQPAGAAATDVYGAVSNVTVKVLAGEEDAVQVVADWARGH